jgi:hypothetical protein
MAAGGGVRGSALGRSVRSVVTSKAPTGKAVCCNKQNTRKCAPGMQAARREHVSPRADPPGPLDSEICLCCVALGAGVGCRQEAGLGDGELLEGGLRGAGRGALHQRGLLRGGWRGSGGNRGKHREDRGIAGEGLLGVDDTWRGRGGAGPAGERDGQLAWGETGGELLVQVSGVCWQRHWRPASGGDGVWRGGGCTRGTDIQAQWPATRLLGRCSAGAAAGLTDGRRGVCGGLRMRRAAAICKRWLSKQWAASHRIAIGLCARTVLPLPTPPL